MKIGWIIPGQQRCGIAIYSRRYIQALNGLGVEIVTLTCGECIESPPHVRRLFRDCTCVHIQYDPAFFLTGSRDHYPLICRTTGRPLVITLHEVYRRFPGIYPRNAIRGIEPLRSLRLWRYDRMHPVPSAFDRHCRKDFFADIVIVHSQDHRAICADKGLSCNKMRVVPHPVPPAPEAADEPDLPRDGAHLMSAGFINPAYDYDLLFAALESLDFPWHFTWIGGIRREEDRPLRKQLETQIGKRGWNGRFIITGWVAPRRYFGYLRRCRVYCALFKNRSTSGSLAEAIAAGVPVVATSIPCVEALLSPEGMGLVVSPDARNVASAITRLLQNDSLRNGMLERQKAYANQFSYTQSARKLHGLYSGLMPHTGVKNV